MTTHVIHSTVKTAVAAMATALFVSCFQHTAHFEYRSTDLDGWHRSQQAEFCVRPVAEDGYYLQEVGVRTDSHYPYRTITLAVDQRVVSTNSRRPDRLLHDTVTIDVYDAGGHPTGSSPNLHQRQVPLKTIQLQAGDSLHVVIRHHMRTSTLQGVANVGFRMTDG